MLNAHFKQMMETRCHHSHNGLQRAQRIKTVLPYCPFLEVLTVPTWKKRKKSNTVVLIVQKVLRRANDMAQQSEF